MSEHGGNIGDDSDDEEDIEIAKIRSENEVLQYMIVSLEQQIEKLSSQLSDTQQLVAVEKEVLSTKRIDLFIYSK